MNGEHRGVVDIVTASAGTGKTRRLELEVQGAVASGGTPPEGVIAVTFTRDAARQLAERVRARLLQSDLRDEAQRLLAARIGTVHAVFGGMLTDFALEAGRSPEARVVAEGTADALFRIAADAAIGAHATALNALARRFGHDATRLDWRKLVREVVDLARQNGIDPGGLGASADASWASLAAALEPPAPDGQALDDALARAVRDALAVLPGGDATKATGDVVETLRETERLLDDGPLPWPRWAKLAGLEPGAVSRAVVQPVVAAATAHRRHPRLSQDLEAFLRGIFACAAAAGEAWQRFKAARGLVDFADQEAAALAMLARPAVAERLREDAALLLVDEFQDTSPMQLALFLRMAALLPRAVWVGDPKQAIYGFRGTDPELMQAVTARLPDLAGGRREALGEMWRSRPALVCFANDLFRHAFLPAIPPALVTVAESRQDTPCLSVALRLWRLHARNAAAAARALAEGVAGMLRAPEAWPVPHWDGRAPGPLRGSDIAVLCRTNDSAAEVAGALAAAGLKVALGRVGLLARAECAAAVAGLHWLADPSDTAALAELAHLAEGDTAAPAWLAAAIASPGGFAAWAARLPEVAALDAARGRLGALTPAEALDAAIAALGLPQRLRAWGDATARLANLEALRGLALAYEAECQEGGLPATAAGLCAWLAAGETDAEEPASPDPDAVQVLTVHRAKGREWPVVVVADLHKEPGDRLFDKPVAMPRDGELDLEDPLAGRWIRFWPWPFARQSKGTVLQDRAAATPIGQADAAAAEREAVRLLYVALTRARDWLVLAPQVQPANQRAPARLKTAWLGLLGDGAPVLPMGEGPILAGGREHPCVALDLHAPTEVAVATDGAPVGPVLPAGPPPEHLPRLVRPHAVRADGGVPAFTREMLGPRLPLAGAPDMAAVGEAVHGFLAADRPAAAPAAREAMAARLLEAWGLAALTSANVVLAGDRLWEWLRARWPGCTWRSEVPVFRRLGRQRLSGRVDLLVEHAGGLAVLDHKTFPGRAEEWPVRAAEHLPQLRTYAGALEAATGRQVTELALHLPVGAVVLVFQGGGGGG